MKSRSVVIASMHVKSLFSSHSLLLLPFTSFCFAGFDPCLTFELSVVGFKGSQFQYDTVVEKSEQQVKKKTRRFQVPLKE